MQKKRAFCEKRALAVLFMAVLLLTPVAMLGASPLTTEAAGEKDSLTVTTGADSGPGSLRDIIAAAKDGDTITFSKVSIVTLTSGELSFDQKNITIDGGTGVIISKSSSGTFRLLNSTASSGTLTLIALTIQNGDPAGPGGGVSAKSSIVLIGCGFTNNSSANGTVYSASGNVTAENTSFFANSVSGGGNAGIVEAGTGNVILRHCTFTKNAGLGTGDSYNVYAGSGTVSAVNCLMTADLLTANSNISISGTDNLIGTDGHAAWFGDNILTFNYIMPLPGIPDIAAATPIAGLEKDAAENTRTAGNCLYGAVNWTAKSWVVTSNIDVVPAPAGSFRGCAVAANADSSANIRLIYFADTLTGGNTIKVVSNVTAAGNTMIYGRLGSDGTPEITLDGNNSARVINHNNAGTLQMFGVNIINGKQSMMGGAGINTVGSLYISACVFTNNYANTSGGAVYAPGGITTSSTFINCTFENNNGTSGAAVYVSFTLKVIGCVFTDNTARTGNGGGIYCGGDATVSGSVFTGNSAAYSYGGGGLFAVNAVITDSVFANNTATGDMPNQSGGGGAYIANSSYIADSIFTNNTAPGCLGGGVFSLNGTFINVGFFENTAAGGAGLRTNSAVIVNCTVSGNITTGILGGAIDTNGVINVIHTTVTNNKGGGVSALSGSTANLFNSIVSGNTDVSGGGLSQITPKVFNIRSLVEGDIVPGSGTKTVIHEEIFGTGLYDPVKGVHEILSGGLASGTAGPITAAALAGTTLSNAQKDLILIAIQKDMLGAERSSTAPSYGAVESTALISETSLVVSIEPAAGSVYGQAVTVNAKLSAASPGSPDLANMKIVFRYDGITLGEAYTDSLGNASIVTDSLPVGVLTFTAEFEGSTELNGCISDDLQYTVGKAETSTSVIADKNPIEVGKPVTFFVTVSAVLPGAGTPTGTIEFYDGPTWIGSAVLGISGSASLTTSGLSAGAHHVTVQYTGDGNFKNSGSYVDENVVGKDTFHYYITATATDGATISPKGMITVDRGEFKTFFFSASAVRVDGVYLSPEDVGKGYYTFRDIRSNHSIEALGTGTISGSPIYLTIDVKEGKGGAEYSVNGSPFVLYNSAVPLMENSSVTVRAVADKGYQFKKWISDDITYASSTESFSEVAASLHLDIYFTEKNHNNLLLWFFLLTALLILAGFIIWFIFYYRRTYEVVRTESKGLTITGEDRARRKRPYHFFVEGAYFGMVYYRVGEDANGKWKAAAPNQKDGGYTIPKGDVIDKITIECR